MTLIQSKTVKIVLYTLWYIVVTFLAVNIYQAGLDTNTQGGRCMPDDWQLGTMYQWVWGNQPCIYTEEFLIGYLFYFILYFVFNYIRQLILGFNPSVSWRYIEVCIWFGFNWGYLLWLTDTNYAPLNWMLIITSFMGTLKFFIPIFTIAICSEFITSHKK